MPKLDQFVSQKLGELEQKQRYRVLKESLREQGVWVTRCGKKLLSFSCNDYLGLSQHSKVNAAAHRASGTNGVGAGASRLITGNHRFYTELEEKLAAMKGTEAALVFGSGYLANIGIIPALVKKGDLILADKLVHACLLDGATLSGATLKRFAHNNMVHVNQLLAKYRAQYRHCLILTDTVFSMDGDLAPIVELRELADEYDAWLLSDDAHGLGMLTRDESLPQAHLQMGTLSKAVGAYGGYVCASKKVIDYLVTSARSFVFSTALPPMIVAAALEALNVMEAECGLRERTLELARFFAQELNLPVPESAIVPLILGEEGKALNASKQLENLGFLVAAIRPPTVPVGTARLRFTFSALHEKQDVVRLIAAVRMLESLD